MTPRLPSAALVLTLLSAACPTPAVADEGFLPNGSMTAGKALPDGWNPPKADAGPGRLTAARDTTTFKEGPASLRLAAEGGSARGGMTCPVPRAAGKDVAVTGWLRTEGRLDRATVAVVCPGADPAFLPLVAVAAAPAWRPFSARLHLPATQEPPQLIFSLEGEGQAWLDEVAVLPGDRYCPEPHLSSFDGPPQFSFLAWDKKVRPAEGGLHVRANSGQGGAGFALPADLSSFADRTPQLTLTLGPAHKARGLRLSLRDADGTSHDYTFKLEGLPRGPRTTVAATDGASVALPNSKGEPGKKAGFDRSQITQFVLIGDWTAEPLGVTLHALDLVEPDAAMTAARRALQDRLDREEKARRQAAEDRQRKKKELLAGAPHPDDGPDVRHAALVAPDVLALTVQEREFVARPQVPYEPAPGDKVERRGSHKVLAVENGQVVETLPEVLVTRKGQTLGHLAVNAGRIKPEDTARGQELTVETVDEPAAYRIASLDDPAWKEPLAPTAVWWKRKPNAPRGVAFQVDVYLKLPHPLTASKTYRVTFPGVNVRQKSVDYRHDPATTRSPAVHVSAIGFRPDDPWKTALLSQWLGTGGPSRYAEPPRFQVLEDASGKPVHSGQGKMLLAADGKESFKEGRNYAKTEVWGLDFSDLKTPGRYRVFVEGIGCSYPFRIAPEVWDNAFRLSMKGLLHHRSGIALGPPLTAYVRPRPMHPADGVKVFASRASELDGGGQDGLFRALAAGRTDRLLPDAWGGHMDAGDWDRNSAHPAAMWLLVDLFELFPEHFRTVKLALPSSEGANAIPDLLDEVLWNLDLYRRLQTADGGVGGGIESTEHPRPGEASWQESLLISAYAPDPRASFIYAGTAAKLARALAPFDKGLADAYAASARKAFTWARDHAEGKNDRRDHFRDARNLAAFELWRLTGEAAYHDDFRATSVLGDVRGDPGRQAKALVSYARLPDGQGDAKLRDAARRWLLQSADAALAFAEGNAFGLTTSIRALPPMGFVAYWSTPEMVFAVLPHAWQLTGDKKYLAGAVRACQFGAGANPDNRALTTGLGPAPVRYPLHVDSRITGQAAPEGITVYGISDPVENFQFDAWAHIWLLPRMVPPSRNWPAHESYWDVYAVPSTNEYTIHQTMIPTAYYWGFLAARPG